MADVDPVIKTAFRRPFAEQVAFFNLRLGRLVPTARWDDLWQEQHDRAFMVAGAVKADLLEDLAQAVRRAVAEGTGFGQFQSDFKAAVERNDWHGWTGEGTKKGEAWRMRVIYKTNMRTSYMAGRHAQLVAGNFKYWVYRHGGSIEPRLDHLSWDGIALPPDHPFWATHFPPNGWGCSCGVFGARTEAGIRRVGGDPAKTLPPGWDRTDPRTGAPRGIGKGWSYAPGATVADLVQALAPKLENLPPAPSIALIQDWLKASIFDDWFAAPSDSWPLLRVSASIAERLGSQRQVAVIPADVAGRQATRWPDVAAADYALAQGVIDGPEEVIDAGPGVLLFLRAGADGRLTLVELTTRDGGLFITAVRWLTAAEAESDRQLRQLRRTGQ